MPRGKKRISTRSVGPSTDDQKTPETSTPAEPPSTSTPNQDPMNLKLKIGLSTTDVGQVVRSLRKMQNDALVISETYDRLSFNLGLPMMSELKVEHRDLILRRSVETMTEDDDFLSAVVVFAYDNRMNMSLERLHRFAIVQATMRCIAQRMVTHVMDLNKE